MGILAVILALWVSLRESRPAGPVQKFRPSADSVQAFARCMHWDEATTKRIAQTPHYLRHRMRGDTLGMTNGHYVVVVASADPYPILRHEWVHLSLYPHGDPQHFNFRWLRATTCGALTHYSHWMNR